MKNSLPLPQEKKLNVVVRIEPGCLGPEGRETVEEFCNFAQLEVEDLDSDFVHWELSPRHDKTLPEMQYMVNEKSLTHDKADKYLGIFDKSLNEFEAHIHDKLALLIDDYLALRAS
ncbi:hypothetical protein BOW53_12070 [Solemya pervernicosa gill symbiont]|uniref:Uncharacterized protein n=2 Tax=Gammaproteobacteria incertae sedis TaxID=118884 RepID=A0A1T2L2H6_9GAMM|nr:hypothetical protein [Candidatus Reidiella endopervernicosa]OOZ39293.1 hypothetical protein BOW53_12070 [Solemya pervernicosa gill symbiont]QKQ25527.1 hypothetical protein HUE57_03850 [Candidatus Reidiella endopervernicosa]